MKNFSLLILLLSFSISIAQTQTEKYNSYLERYEFFNAKGTMIGYKKYNSYLKQWEYTDLNSSNSSSSYYDNIPVYEPNYELINQVLAKKEANYMSNEVAYEELLKEVGIKLRSFYGAGSKSHTKALERFKFIFNNRLDKWTNSSGRIDISNDNVWRGLKNDIIDSYNTTLKYIPRENELKKENPTPYSNSPKEKYSQLKYSGAKLRAEPNIDSRIIYRPLEFEKVKILKEESVWVKVEVNNKTGYIPKTWLKGYQVEASNYKSSISNAKFKYSGAKVRLKPSINSTIIYESNKKETVKILREGKDSVWVRIEIHGKVGYIVKNWLER